MAVRDSRRKPGMTVGQRMRNFSRSVMRHYAPLPGDVASVPQSAPSPVAPPPNWAEPADTSAAEPQFVASAPLPFDTSATEQTAPLLPPAELPVYAPDPPLPQYVVPATPAPAIQRTEQPARPAGDIAIGPDGRPLLHNGKPIPVDSDPTPPALLELMQRQRQRDAEVQRLKEERTEILKAELPPTPEDSDAPRSSRIRRRGSADVDYIQTKALADKREPGDTAPDPKPNVKSPREPEQQESQSLDDDDESNGDGAGSASFEAPTDDASPVTQSADISTASESPAIQRAPDIETPAPFAPFDAPLDAPLAEPDAMPEVSSQPLPFAEPQIPAPLDAPPAPSVAVQRQPDVEAPEPSLPPELAKNDQPATRPAEQPVSWDISRPAPAPQVSAPTVQHRPEPDASEPQLPLSEPTAAPDAPQARQDISPLTPPQPVQRQVTPEIEPPIPFEVPAEQPHTPDGLQAPSVPSPSIPSIYRETEREIPAPSLPFELPTIEHPVTPELSRPLVVDAPEAALPVVMQTQSASPSVQRQTEAEGPETGLPLDDARVVPDAPIGDDGQPQLVTASKTLAPPEPAPPEPALPIQTPPVQRQTDVEIPAPLPFNEPVTSDTVIPRAEQLPSPDTPLSQASMPQAPAQTSADTPSQTPSAAIQREPEAFTPAPSLPFDAPVNTEATVQELPRPVQHAAPLAAVPDIMPPSQEVPAVQRQAETEAITPPLPFETSPEQPRPLEVPRPTTELTDAAPNATSPAIQRQPAAEIPAPTLPFDLPSGQQSAPLGQPEQPAALDAPQSPATAELNAPKAAVQRQPEKPAPPHVSPDAQQFSAEPHPMPAQTQTPAIQRDAELEMDAPLLPFEAPEIEQAAPDVSQHMRAEAPAVQRLIEPENIARPLAFETPPANEQVTAPDISQPLANPVSQPPTIQRQADAEPFVQPLPFGDAALPDLALPDAQPTMSEAAQTSTADTGLQPETAASALQTALPAVHRQAERDATEALPFDAPSVSSDVQPAAQPLVQSSEPSQAPAASSLPVPTVQREQAADAPVPQRGVPELVVQRQSQVETDTPALPFEAPPSVMQDAAPSIQSITPQESLQAALPSNPAPAIQRRELEAPASPLPFDDPQLEQTEQPHSGSATRSNDSRLDWRAPLEVSPQTTMPPAAVPTVQRQTGPEIAPVPFDPTPAVQPPFSQAQPPAAPESLTPESSSAPQSSMPELAPAVQRLTAPETMPVPLPFDPTPVGQPPFLHAQPPAAPESLTPEPSSAPQSSMPELAPAVQRQTDVAAHTPAPQITSHIPAALPFDDLDAVVVQRTAVQPAAQAPQPVALPFDPVASEGSPAIQRTPAPEQSDPFSTPGTMPAGVPAEGRMDVFQALVAAGMVSRPPGGSAMPAVSQPLLQRSPSRESYLANMAQRQESAGMVTGPIQRALSEGTESNPPAPDAEDDEAPEIDVNQLASDVMRMLRGKLRSEHERLSKR